MGEGRHTKLLSAIAIISILAGTFTEGTIAMGLFVKHPEFSMKKYEQLDAEYLREIWDFRVAVFPQMLTALIFLAVGYAAMLYITMGFPRLCPMELHETQNFMRICFALASLIPAFEFVATIGTFQEAKNYSQLKAFSLKDPTVTSEHEANLRALEISYNMSESSFLWLFSSQFVMFSLAFFSVTTLMTVKGGTINGYVIGKKFGRFTFFMGLLAMVVFIAELTAVNDIGPRYLFGILYLLFGVVLMPVWIYIAGFKVLPYARRYDDMTRIGGNEMNEAVRNQLHPADVV